MNKLSALKRFSDAKPIIVQSYFQAFYGKTHLWAVITYFIDCDAFCDEKLMRARKLSYLEKRRKTYHLYPTIILLFPFLHLILSNTSKTRLKCNADTS